MGGGDRYSREPQSQTRMGEPQPPARTIEQLSKQSSLIAILTNKAGYNKEKLEGIELEAKIDMYYGWPPLFLKRDCEIRLGEQLNFKEPYSRDEILEESQAIHSCFAFINKDFKKLEYAFIKMEKEDKTKFKIKEQEEQAVNNGIILLKRKEKVIENFTPELNKYLSDKAKEKNSYLGFIGSFFKRSKDAFVFNNSSGRIFVVSTNICKAEQDSDILYQLELEYYGQANGFSSLNNPEDDLADLANIVLKNSCRNYKMRNSTLTKFEWMAQKYKI